MFTLSSVRSGLVSDPAMREEALDLKMVAAVDRYLKKLLNNESATAEAVGIDAEYLRKNCLREQYPSGENTAGNVELFVRLEFDKRFRDEMDRRYRHFISFARLQTLGGVGQISMVLLGDVVHLFEIDTRQPSNCGRRGQIACVIRRGANSSRRCQPEGG